MFEQVAESMNIKHSTTKTYPMQPLDQGAPASGIHAQGWFSRMQLRQPIMVSQQLFDSIDVSAAQTAFGLRKTQVGEQAAAHEPCGHQQGEHDQQGERKQPSH